MGFAVGMEGHWHGVHTTIDAVEGRRPRPRRHRELILYASVLSTRAPHMAQMPFL